MNVGSGSAGVPDPMAEALALALERYADARGSSGEPYVDHGAGTAAILREVQADEASCTAALLFGGDERIPVEEVGRRFGGEVMNLVQGVRQVLRLRELHLRVKGGGDASQLETLRRLLMAMASDIRVVLIRLSSRLQTLRWHAAARTAPAPGLVQETLDVLAPLANRLGLWQLKWELEDLAFRFEAPEVYRDLARQLEDKRRERAAFVDEAMARLQKALEAQGIRAELSGRPKHLYSIWKKMRHKDRAIEGIQDLRALRVIVPDVHACYQSLDIVHQLWSAIPSEYDDYIARPKANGYQSLHTVVSAEDGRPLEVQIRTGEMHRFAEYGVASHWRYKEGGAQRAEAALDARIEWMRQLLAWQRDLGAQLAVDGAPTAVAGTAAPAPDAPETPEGAARIYVLTPQARLIELPEGSTPVDFAYHVHTNLGHRCRGARVDGQMVPLNTPLRNGQTVDIVSARSGSGNDGPSRDWLNTGLGYVRSNRARAKVRQWFSALELQRDAAQGRERVEKVLQREGRTSLAFEELARRLDYETPEALFVAITREEVGPRMLEDAVRVGPPPAGASPPGGESVSRDELERATSVAAQNADRRARRQAPDDGVLVVGVDLLMTQLARCCRPVPPDDIAGFVTRGRGVSVHRRNCRDFQRMARLTPERVLDTAWGDRPAAPLRDGKAPARHYPVDVLVRATDRQGLLHEVTEIFARDRLNVIAVRTLSRQQQAHMEFTVEVADTSSLRKTLASLADVRGVFEARRK